MKSITMIMVFIFIGLAASGVQAEIYSWTDENGVKHYSHTPPPDRSVPIKTAPEIRSESKTDQEIEKLNEENIEAILKALEKEEQASASKQAKTQNLKKFKKQKIKYLKHMNCLKMEIDLLR